MCENTRFQTTFKVRLEEGVWASKNTKKIKFVLLKAIRVE